MTQHLPTVGRAALLGLTTGARSFSGLAAQVAVTPELADRQPERTLGRPAREGASSGWSPLGELVGDKLPTTPSRLTPTVLASRLCCSPPATAVLVARAEDERGAGAARADGARAGARPRRRSRPGTGRRRCPRPPRTSPCPWRWRPAWSSAFFGYALAAAGRRGWSGGTGPAPCLEDAGRPDRWPRWRPGPETGRPSARHSRRMADGQPLPLDLGSRPEEIRHVVRRPQPSSLFELQFPQSVGIYNTYDEAQRAVDYLADEKFEVQNLAIVGTDLKSVERVLGRRNWGTVVAQGVQSGLSTGLLVALVLLIFSPPDGELPRAVLRRAGHRHRARGSASPPSATRSAAAAATSPRSARPSPPSTRSSASTRSPRRPARCCSTCPAPAPPRSSRPSSGTRTTAQRYAARSRPTSGAGRRTAREGRSSAYSQRLRLNPAYRPTMISAIRPRTM